MGEMLSVKNINVYYGSIHAIKDISFQVNDGEVVTLIGACGFRVLWVYTVFAVYRELRVLYLSYPISWILTSLVHLVCYFIVKRQALRAAGEGVSAT